MKPLQDSIPRKDGTERSRIWRSREARAVRDVLLAQVERAALVAFSAGKLRHGRMFFTVQRSAARGYRLLLDVDASSLIVVGLLPGVGEQTSSCRDLRNFIKSCSVPRAASTLRLDRQQGEVRVIVDGKGVAIAMQVKNAEYEYCARYLVELAEEITKAILPPDRHYPFLERPHAALSVHG